MDFTGIDKFRLVPKWGGNRDLDPVDRLSLNIRRMPTIEVLAQDDTPDTLHKWVEDMLEEWKPSSEISAGVLAFSDPVIAAYRQFVGNTSDFRNVKYEGRQLEDPREIFIYLPVAVDEDTGESLLGEINNSINKAAQLHGEELKNFVSQCAGEGEEILS